MHSISYLGPGWCRERSSSNLAADLGKRFAVPSRNRTRSFRKILEAVVGLCLHSSKRQPRIPYQARQHCSARIFTCLRRRYTHALFRILNHRVSLHPTQILLYSWTYFPYIRSFYTHMYMPGRCTAKPFFLFVQSLFNNSLEIFVQVYHQYHNININFMQYHAISCNITFMEIM